MTAERVPTTTRASPRRIRHQASCRSPADSPEWSAATPSPASAATRSTSCATTRDLRHEDDRRAARLEGRGQRREVDVRLARGGDALEEQLAAGGEAGDRGHRSALLGCELVARWCASGAVRERIATSSRQSSTAAPRAASRRAGASSRAASTPSSSASSGNVALPVPTAASSARWSGARVGTWVRPHPASRRTRTRRAASSGAPKRPCRAQQGAGATKALEPRLHGRGAARGAGAARPRSCRRRPRGCGPARQRARLGDVPRALEPRLEPRRQHGGDRRADRRAVVGGATSSATASRSGVSIGSETIASTSRSSVASPPVVRRSRQQVAQRQAAAVRDEDERTRLGRAEGIGQEVGERALRSVGKGVDRDAHRAAGHRVAQTRIARGGSRRASAWMISQICSAASSG